VISWNKEAIGLPFCDCFACLFFGGGVLPMSNCEVLSCGIRGEWPDAGMGIFECRTRESPPKRRRLSRSPMQMDNNCSSTMLGPSGLIKKHEFVRLMIQCLQHLGFPRTSSCLEAESGILYKPKDFEVLESDILSANWEGCIKSLEGMKGLADETRSSALFLVIKQ